MTITHSRYFIAPVLILNLLVGCGEIEGEISIDSVSHTDEDRIATWEEFKQTATPMPDGSYLIDYDIRLANEEELRFYYETYRTRELSDDALTVHRMWWWGWYDNIYDRNQAMNLTYCISDEFEFKEYVVETLEKAFQTWEDIIQVDFKYLPEEDGNCNRFNRNVYFDIRPANWWEENYFKASAYAFHPRMPRMFREMVLYESLNYRFDPAIHQNPCCNEVLNPVLGTLRHEVGHILGFRHEHIWVPKCLKESDPFDRLVGTKMARQVTKYDPKSIMHYSSCDTYEFTADFWKLSELDVEGARKLYPPR